MLIHDPQARRPMRSRAAAPAAGSRAGLLTGAVAGGIAALALQGGGYGLGIRSVVGIAVWWAIGLAALAGLRPASRLPRAGIAALAALAGLALVTGTSASWADSTEAAVTEFGRVMLYLGAFAAVAMAARAATATAWADGLGAGVVLVALAALASRLLPDLGLGSSASSFFPGGFTFLSYPLEYWNALAVLIALGLPLVLRAAAAAPTAVARGLWLAPVPALLAALYLTSSRGGVLAALIGVGALAALGRQPARILAAAGVAAAAGAAAIAAVSAHDHLVNGPFDAPGIEADGQMAAILVAASCMAAGLAWGRLSAVRLQLPRLGRSTRTLLLVGAVAATAATVVAADPAARLKQFAEPPANRVEAAADPDFSATAAQHLTSSSGNGRWQFWTAAAEQFADRPLLGHGAGSYEAWWAQHGSISYFTRQAHSLYLETLGELGLVGFTLLALFLVLVGAVTARRLARSSGDERLTAAALAATALAFAAAAGIDWMWEMTVVTLVGIAACAVLVGSSGTAIAAGSRPSRRGRWLLAAAALVGVAALGLPFLADREIRESRRAAVAGDTGGALDAARRAARLAPWAGSPWLQRALVHEGAGDLDGARRAAAEAVRHDGGNWRHHLVLARVAQAQGDQVGADASLRRAIRLNPRSPLFQGR